MRELTTGWDRECVVCGCKWMEAETDRECPQCSDRYTQPSDHKMVQNETTQQQDKFELAFDDHVGLARRILAAVSDTYTETELDDIGRRARHWVMKAFREWGDNNNGTT